MAQTHAIALPPYREGTPRSLLEAMAVGRALVATDVRGCREVVTAGVTGFLCSPQNADSLADAMKQVATLHLNDLRLMGPNSRNRATQEYDEKLVISAYQRALRDIVLD